MATGPQPTERVFLSYSHSDRTAAIALRAALERAGLSVFKDDDSLRTGDRWLERAGLSVFKDDDSLRTGDRWLERLQEVLQACSAFVVLAGRDGVRRWVGAEVQVALVRHLSVGREEDRLPIFPILLEEARPEALPPFLALFQASRWTPAEALPAGLVDAIRAHAVRLDSPPAIEGCPFLGLNAFSSKDSRLFFGRRKETLEALTYLGDQQQANPEGLRGGGGAAYCRWLQIEGNSGTGKSSLVNAGMLPMIEQGALWARTGFERWRVLGPMMPGRDPLTRLVEVVEHGLIRDEGRRNMLDRQHVFERDPRALAFALRDARNEQSAFLLIVDQFEELFTFADAAARQQFDALLAGALQDGECPLFVISTVRADFLDRFEQLPRLQAIYNSHCRRYFLPTISEHGLREVIEQPARLAGLDVSEVATAIIDHARDEIGALPLVENALFTLWQQRQGNALSGERYRRANGIAGMLSAQADELLARIDGQVRKGRQAALELLLRLTRINDEGRHTRQRIARDEALLIAGDGRPEVGERVLQLLSGERRADVPASSHAGALRLITISMEQEQQYVDLIHETLIRARGRDEQTGKAVAYWPTLYDCIEKNRDRDMLRQQLRFQAERWGQSGALGRWWNLAGWHDLWRYRRLRIDSRSTEGRFAFWSRWAGAAQLAVLLALLGVFGEAAWWANRNNLPFGYTFKKPLWFVQSLARHAPLPEMVEIPPGSFTMGCLPGRDDVERARCGTDDVAHPVTLSKPFALGRYELTFGEYDYYVWDQQRHGKAIEYPPDAGWGRADRPVINVSWDDAKAYTEWLGRKTGTHYRLPTEAEWEYAARAGTGWAYWWGKDFADDKANCAGSKTTPVHGRYPPNPWGLHDTAGNVWEWVEDGYAPNVADPARDPPGAREGVSRVLRGGSWDYSPWNCRAANRNDNAPDNRNNNIGFRVCRGAHIVIIPVRRQRVGWRLPEFPADHGLPDEAGERSMAQACPVRTRLARRAHSKTGRHLDSLPWRPPFSVYRLQGALCLIQPPSKRPISATMPLTCAYWPSLSQLQRCASRRYSRRRLSAASASCSAVWRRTPRALCAVKSASWQSSAASIRRRVTVWRYARGKRSPCGTNQFSRSNSRVNNTSSSAILPPWECPHCLHQASGAAAIDTADHSAAFAQICNWPHLLHAFQRAACGKRRRPAVATFEFQVADRLLRLRADLLDGSYSPGPYTHFFIHEPKQRKISAATFRDRVVHHALCAVIEPRFERVFIPDSYANRIGKGSHRAIDRLQQFARRHRYVLRADLRQHFASIDHAILLDSLRSQVPEADIMQLIELILAGGRDVLRD